VANVPVWVRIEINGEEYDLNDFDNYALQTDRGIVDGGSEVTLRLQVPTKPKEGGAGKLERLRAEIERRMDMARLYEEEGIGYPVDLKVYWPESGTLSKPPVWGRGWRRKRIVGGFCEETNPDLVFGDDFVPELMVRFFIEDDADGAYSWRHDDLMWVPVTNFSAGDGDGYELYNPSTNLITNPDFETNTTDWATAGGTCTIAQDAVYHHTGDWSLSQTPDGIAVSSIARFVPTCAEGTQYTLSAWVFIPCGVDPGKITLRLGDDNGAGTWVYNTSAAITVSGEWVRLDAIRTMRSPGGGQVYRADLLNNATPPVSEIIYWDSVQLEAHGYATKFIEPDVNLGETWTGTAHGSTSARVAVVVRVPYFGQTP